MKTLLLLSTLLAPSLGDLLIPKSVYQTHTLFKSANTGEQCDDCCDNPVDLQFKVRFFGVDYLKFWPCANGLISFNDEVRAYTPDPFPIAQQPIIAAFWGDVDLRPCKPSRNSHCSYHKVHYGTEANLLDGLITSKYLSGTQTFTAKLAIVQTWDEVGYYDLQTARVNTFQLVIVSDGALNAFAAFYYGRLGWTTGDVSEGDEGLGGIQAQMGFDAGNLQNFFKHPYSRTADVLKLANQEFVYAISNTKICPSGSQLDGTTCVALSCSMSQPFPIRDASGSKKIKDDGTPNPNYKDPTNVGAGNCANLLKSTNTTQSGYEKVKHGVKCTLKCQYQQTGAEATWLTFQPKNYGSTDAQKQQSEAGVTAECVNAEWKEKAAKSCVEVGINYKVLGTGDLRVREPADGDTQAIEVSLKSKPYGIVLVNIQTSCKDGTPSTKEASGAYSCPAGNLGTTPLAAIKTSSGGLLYSQTVTFGPGHKAWDSPQKVEIKGIDNSAVSANGYESFTVRLSVSQSQNEDCSSSGCSDAKPYNSLKKVVAVPGKLLDDEGIELKPTSLTTDETGKKVQFSITSRTSLANKQVSCKSSDPLEGKITAYTIDGGPEIPFSATDVVTFGTGSYSFIVTGQPDNVVDGPKTFDVDCTATGNSGSILGVTFTNLDMNVPGVIVNTTMSKKFYKQGVDAGCPATDARPNKMPDGCGILQTSEGGPCDFATSASRCKGPTEGDFFSVQLVTKPREGVVVVRVAPSYSRDPLTGSKKKKVFVSPQTVEFTQLDWNKPKTFRVVGIPDDVFEGTVLSTVDISIDSGATTDRGYTKAEQGTKTIVLGYSNCGEKRAGRRLADSQTQQDLDDDRADMYINCFSYETAKIMGSKVGAQPDAARLSLDVQTKNDTPDPAPVIAGITGAIAAVIVVVVIVALAVFIAGLLVALAVKKKRGEEAQRKQTMKEDASKKENDIQFHLDDEGEFDLESNKGTQDKLKDERDRLAEENVTLSEQAGESPMVLADTEDPDAIVEQIKELKSENDRLRESAKSGKRQRKKKPNKKTGFGQHMDQPM